MGVESIIPNQLGRMVKFYLKICNPDNESKKWI